MDIEIVKKAISGDAGAFEQLMLSEERYLRGLALGQLGRTDAAQDAVQEALMHAWKNIQSLRNPAAYKGWLGTIVIHTCKTMLRRKGRERTVPLEPALLSDARNTASAEPSPLLAERSSAMAAAIQTLDDETQMVLALKYSQGLDYAQIAAQLGVTSDAVRVRIFRAREKLREKLSRRDNFGS